MLLAKKVRLLPNSEQEKQLWKSAGTSRYVYNWALSKQIEHFEIIGKLTKISDNKLRKELTQLKQSKDYEWLYDISNNIAKQAVKDACNAIDRFHEQSKKFGYRYRKSAIKSGNELTIKDYEDFPRFKSRKKSKPSFYNDTSKLKVKVDEVLIEKVGWVKLSETNRIHMNVKYYNPRVSYDGKYWYISVSVEEKEPISEKNDLSIGIDLGLKDLAVVSHFDKPFKNINKTNKVKKIKKKLERLKKQVSRKYEINKIPIGEVGENHYKYIKTNNILKLEEEIKLTHRMLSNIRLNHIHQITTAIVKTKPCRIIVEDLNIKDMMKNKNLAKAIQEQCFNKFISILEYKCKFNSIVLEKADRFYPSSKICSCCGEIKKDLKLKDRVFICPSCNFKIDRDKNAAMNLSRYKKSA
jgi:putative transposase